MVNFFGFSREEELSVMVNASDAGNPKNDPPGKWMRDQPRRLDSEFQIGDGATRVGAGCLAICFGLFAVWMWWIVDNFLVGGGWFNLIVTFVLDDLILAVGLLALTFVIWALFAPAWIPRMFAAARKSVVKAIAFFFLLLLVPGLLFVVGWSVLWSLGIVK